MGIQPFGINAPDKDHRIIIMISLKKLWVYRETINSLALREFQSRYAGTAAGILWTFIQPVTIVAVFYFVFSIGFKAKAPDNVPFILWFCVGLMAWFYFSETLTSIVGVISNNANLVKKTVFPVEVLPVIQIQAGIIQHLIFMSIVLVVLLIYGTDFKLFRLTVFYYMIAVSAFILGIGLILSSIAVFWKDVSQGISVVLNIWFWITPIVWDQAIMPEEYNWIFSWNPMFYIVEGYRGALIYPEFISPDFSQALFFWGVTFILLGIGSYVFRRLKPEFADVL